MTKVIIVTTRVENNNKTMSQHSKECCNKVEELVEETSIATKENYVVTKDEEERTEDCRDKEIYVAIEFRLIENDKLCCKKVFLSRHKILISRHKLDNFSRTMSRHYQSLSRPNSRRNPKIMSRQKTGGHNKSWGT